MMACISLEALGGFVDGWAHNHFHRLETFFTPWHALLYGGFASAAVFLISASLYWHAKGYPWPRSLPAGYGLSLAGVAIFVVGGLLDMAWHLVFGIEHSVSALLSPTHLVLAVGDTLIGLGPLRSVLARNPDPSNWRDNGPFVLSLVWLLGSLTFFTQYASPIGLPLAANSWRPPAHGPAGVFVSLGVASAILQSILLMGTLLFAMRARRIPRGACTLILADNTGLMAFMRQDSLALPAAIVIGIAICSGIVADLIAASALVPAAPSWRMRAFAFVVPALFYGSYFAAIGVLAGSYWPMHLLVGVPVAAGLCGLLMSYCIL